MPHLSCYCTIYPPSHDFLSLKYVFNNIQISSECEKSLALKTDNSNILFPFKSQSQYWLILIRRRAILVELAIPSKGNVFSAITNERK